MLTICKTFLYSRGHNVYEHRFSRVCPANSKIIDYHLSVQSSLRIMVEDIIDAVSKIETCAYHEDIADLLASAISGSITLRAHHHGVDITTYRTGKSC